MTRRSFLRRTFGPTLAIMAGFYGWQDLTADEQRTRFARWLLELKERQVEPQPLFGGRWKLDRAGTYRGQEVFWCVPNDQTIPG